MARDIDRSIGALSGEASGQRAGKEVPLRSQAFPYVPSSQSTESPSYYDHPMLKEPTWIWSIPTYFYVGGVTGVSAALGAAAQVLAPRSMRSLVVKTRWIGTVGGAMSAVLLIHDLGRPERFLNMLRVFRVSSPMSMGSWILSAFSTCIGGAAVLPEVLAAPLGLLGGFLGLGLSGYTGVLISQTSVPLWRAGYRTMPVLFLASGTAAAAGFLEFLPLTPKETVAVERFGLMGKIVELLAAFALDHDAAQTERVAKPLKDGFSGFVWQTAKILTFAGIVLAVAPGKGRTKRVAGGILATAASVCVRFGVFYAGKASARDPRGSFEQQRAESRPES
jgi:formate-dependent nitrite reductase membrane component NrfD